MDRAGEDVTLRPAKLDSLQCFIYIQQVCQVQLNKNALSIIKCKTAKNIERFQNKPGENVYSQKDHAKRQERRVRT